MSTEIGPWTYDWQERPRPFVHPVRTPAGHVLSVDAPADHPWHHGLWFTIKFVNGENFWEEYDEYGTLRQADPPRFSDEATATSQIDWVRPDGSDVVATESCAMSHSVVPDGWALDWDVRFVPAVDVELDRTPFTTWGGYGGLTMRGRPDWHDTELRLPDGHGRDRVLGEPGAWCALDGPIATGDGDAEVGLVVLDHPDNPGHPVPWYASTRADTYGDEGWSNFCNAAFLWDGPRSVAAGDELRLRYRVIVHDGRWPLDQLADAWSTWSTS